MDENAAFEAGRKVECIEEFFRGATEYSQRLYIRASEISDSQRSTFLDNVVYMSIEDAIFHRGISIEEFRQKTADYRRRMVEAYQDFEKIAQEFPHIPYFKNESNAFRMKLNYETALATIDNALQRSKPKKS